MDDHWTVEFSLGKHIDLALGQGVQKGLSSRRWFCFTFERAKQHRLRSGEGFASNAGGPFLQHELSRSLRIRDHEPLADLVRLNDHRLSPTRHVEILPPLNVADGMKFLAGSSHDPA